MDRCHHIEGGVYAVPYFRSRRRIMRRNVVCRVLWRAARFAEPARADRC